MNRRRLILAVLAAAVALAVVITAAEGDLGGKSSGSGPQVAAPGALPHGSSPSGGANRPHPHAITHPPVAAQLRTHPRLEPDVGGRNTTFTLSFRRRRNLGPHGHKWSYYGVIVSPLAAPPPPGCYGFGRYVMDGRKGQLARVPIHPRKRLWCAGSYQVGIYLTGKPYCPPSRKPHPCSTASYAAVPTGWAYFSVR
jgi:hypothetical protein